MSTINALPEELLFYILEQATFEQTSSSNLHLLLVNKLFARLAYPLLYRHISDVSVDDGALLIRRLTHAVICDPSKATLIQSLTIKSSGDYLEDYEISNGKHDPFSEQSASVRSRIQLWLDEAFDEKVEGAIHSKLAWSIECLEDMSTAHLFALVFPRLSALRELIIWDMSDETWLMLGHSLEGLTARERKLGGKLPLAALETVSMGGEAPEYPHTTMPLAIIAKLPNVKHVYGRQTGDGDNFHQDEPDAPFLRLEPRSRDMKSVKFRPNSKLFSEHLTRFLGVAKALESFEYHIGHTWAWIPLKTSELSQALSQHTHSLRSLILHVRDPEFDSDDAEFEPMNFSKFKCLEKLDLACPLLVGCNEQGGLEPMAAKAHALKALPHSLKDFSLVQCDDKFDVKSSFAALAAIIQEKKNKLPRLERVLWGCSKQLDPVLKAFLRVQSVDLHEIAKGEQVSYQAVVHQERGEDNQFEFVDIREWEDMPYNTIDETDDDDFTLDELLEQEEEDDEDEDLDEDLEGDAEDGDVDDDE